MDNEGVLSRNQAILHHELAAGRQSPAAGAESAVQNSAVLNLGEVDDAVGLDLNLLRVQPSLQDRRRLVREGLGAEAVVRARPVDLIPVFVSYRRRRRIW